MAKKQVMMVNELANLNAALSELNQPKAPLILNENDIECVKQLELLYLNVSCNRTTFQYKPNHTLPAVLQEFELNKKRSEFKQQIDACLKTAMDLVTAADKEIETIDKRIDTMQKEIRSLKKLKKDIEQRLQYGHKTVNYIPLAAACVSDEVIKASGVASHLVRAHIVNATPTTIQHGT